MTAAVVACVLVLQAVQAPPRDKTATASTGHASIAGHVVDADTQTPLRRAIVRLSGTTLSRRLTLRTDLSGRFEFTGLPAGRYTLTAAKARYLTLEYGQRRPFEQGRRLEAAERQSLRDVVIALPRAGAISGTVHEPGGDPIDRMRVAAFREGYAGGVRRLIAVQQTMSNDIGQYRLSGLAPGDYFVVAREVAIPPTEFTDDGLSYARTYYQATVDRQQAQRVRVGLGQEIVNLDMPVVIARTATLRGTVVRTDGSPLTGARVDLLDGPDSGTENNVTGAVTAGADGGFRISGVTAAAYQLTVTSGQEEGVLPVRVSGSDLSTLTLVVGPGGKVRGRVVSASGQPLPFSAGAVQLAARVTDDPWAYRRAATAIKPDWTFESSGLLGPRVLRPARLPDGWWLKAVIRGQTDLTDSPVVFSHGETIDDVTVVLDDRPTVLAGVVTDRQGQRVADYTVVAFPPDPSRWGAETRFVRAERPDHAGRFRIAGLPPGEYLVAAVDYVEQGQWLDPLYLESLREGARKVTLEPAGQKEAALVVTGK